MPKNKSLNQIIPLVLFVFSFLLRLSLMSKGPFSGVSLDLALKAQETASTLHLSYFYGSGYPLTIIVFAVFNFIASLFSIHDPVQIANFTSVLFGSLSIVVFYHFIKKLLKDDLCALLGALTLSFCPIFLGVSVYGQSHAIELFIFLIGLIFLLDFFETSRTKFLFLSAIFTGLLGALRLQDLIFLLPAIYVLIFFHMRRANNGSESRVLFSYRQLLIFHLILFTTSLIFYLPYILSDQRMAYIEQLSRFRDASISGDLINYFLPSLQIYLTWLTQNFSFAGMIASLIGFVILFKKLPKIFLFCLIWFLIPFTFYIFLDTTMSRFFTIFLPPLIITQSFLFSSLIRINSIFRITTLLAYIIILISVSLQILPVLYFRHHNALLPDHAKWVKNLTEENAHIIVGDDQIFYSHYSQRPILKRPRNVFFLSNNSLIKFQSQLDNLLETNIPVYITYVGLYDYDPEQKFSNFLSKNYRLEYIGEKSYEDYHHGEMAKRVFTNPLLQIKQR